jgi:hypothetical protein
MLSQDSRALAVSVRPDSAPPTPACRLPYLARLGSRRLPAERSRLYEARLLLQLVEIALERIPIRLRHRLIAADRLFQLVSVFRDELRSACGFTIVNPADCRIRRKGKGRAVGLGQPRQIDGEAVPLAAAFEIGGLRLHEAVDLAGLLQDRRGLIAGRVFAREPLPQVVDVLLQVVEIVLDIHFATRPAHDRPLQLAIQLILEPIASVIDRLEDLRDVLVRKSFAVLRR